MFSSFFSRPHFHGVHRHKFFRALHFYGVHRRKFPFLFQKPTSSHTPFWKTRLEEEASARASSSRCGGRKSEIVESTDCATHDGEFFFLKTLALPRSFPFFKKHFQQLNDGFCNMINQHAEETSVMSSLLALLSARKKSRLHLSTFPRVSTLRRWCFL